MAGAAGWLACRRGLVIAWAGVAGIALPGGWVAAQNAVPGAGQPLPSSQIRAEARLLEVIDRIGQHDLDGALQAVAELTREIPNFHAARLVQADLLRFRSGRLAGAGLAQTGEGGLRLRELQEELRRRLHAGAAAPAPGTVPREFLQISPAVPHAIAVDASKSRLYLFANGAQGPRLIADFYVSVGKLGIDKRAEGDQRTPLGIYFVTGQIAGAKLPAFYGKGALPLNYPNDWDRAVGRNGSGIWLHGAPPDQFARVPEASDGCLVLANPDMELLMRTVGRRTPTLIRERLDWVSPQEPQQRRATDAFRQVLDGWQASWRGQDWQERVAALYGENLLQSPALRQRLRQQAEHMRSADYALRDVSVYAWSDARGEIRVVNLHAASRVYPRGLRLRQYWRQDGGGWKVFSEDVLN